MRALNIAASGVLTHQQRHDVTAHNTANAQTARFKAQRANQVEQSSGGVAATAPTRMEHAAGPQIEGEEGSNVDLAQEMVDANVNVRSLQANVKAFQAADEMFRTVIDMKA